MASNPSIFIRMSWLAVSGLLFAICTKRLFAARVSHILPDCQCCIARSIKTKRVAVITAIFGSHEKTLKPTANQSIPTHFLAFTNNRTVVSRGAWQVDTTPYHILFKPEFDDGSYVNSISNNKHPHNVAKYYKMQFHRIPRLKNFHYIIWIDSSFSITSSDFSKRLISAFEAPRCIPSPPVAIYEHAGRSNYDQEAMYSKQDIRWSGVVLHGIKQPFQNLTRQQDFYVQQGFTADYYQTKYQRKGLWTGGTSVWDMRHPKVQSLLDNWYLQNLNFTTQDQVGFPYAVWITNVIPCVISTRNVYNNGLVHYYEHGF